MHVIRSALKEREEGVYNGEQDFSFVHRRVYGWSKKRNDNFNINVCTRNLMRDVRIGTKHTVSALHELYFLEYKTPRGR